MDHLFRLPVDERLERYDHLIIHCSATSKNAYNDSYTINRMHLDKGFSNGNGYHAIITRNGEIQTKDRGFPCRSVGQAGAHVGTSGRGWNGRSLGVCLIGGVDRNQRPENNFTGAQFKALEEYCVAAIEAHPKTFMEIMGHYQLIKLTGAPPKACPCFDAKQWAKDRNILSRGKEKDMEDTFLSIPSPMDVPQFYYVQKGDTLSEISEMFRINLNDIIRLNQNINPDKIEVKQKVQLW